MRAAFIFLFICFFPVITKAQVEINEIMYDLEGADSGREWVEIFNNSTNEVNLSGWKFYDGSNHVLNEPPKNGGKGLLILSAYQYAVFADKAEIFVFEHPEYEGILIDTVVALNNTEGILKLFNKEGVEIDSVSYDKSIGANGDGNSLQKINGDFKAAPPSMGKKNTAQTQKTNQNSDVNTDYNENDFSENNAAELLNQINNNKFFTEKNIKTFAGEDKTGVVGADIEFNGKSLGLNDEPLLDPNTRFVWNFGDGASKEGRVVRHVYSFPGDYIVFLNTASGKYSASDRLDARIIPNEIKISEISPFGLWLEIFNGSRQDIDISRWQINQENNFFIFPENTFIKKSGFLVVSKEILGFYLNPEKGTVKLLYSNGSAANEFSYGSGATEGETYGLINGEIVKTTETPGMENIKSALPLENKNNNPLSLILTQKQDITQNNNFNNNGIGVNNVIKTEQKTDSVKNSESTEIKTEENNKLKKEELFVKEHSAAAVVLEKESYAFKTNKWFLSGVILIISLFGLILFNRRESA